MVEVNREAAAAEGFRGPQVCSLVGITYRQLDYWARTGLLRPSIADATGSGSQRRYSYSDVLELKVIKRLLDAGLKLQQARQAVGCLRGELGVDLASAQLVLADSRSILARSDGEIGDLLAVRPGKDRTAVGEHQLGRSQIDTEFAAQAAHRLARLLQLEACVEQPLDDLELEHVAVGVAALAPTSGGIGNRWAQQPGACPVVQLPIGDADQRADLRATKTLGSGCFPIHLDHGRSSTSIRG